MTAWITYLVTAAGLTLVALIRPFLARQNELFGVVFGTRNLRQDLVGRSLKQQYLVETIALAVLVWGGLALMAWWRRQAPYLALDMIAFLLAALAVTANAHRQSSQYHKQLAVPEATRISVDLTQLANEKTLSPVWGLVLLPMVVLSFALPWSAVAWANLAVALVVGGTFLLTRHLAANVHGLAAAPGAAQARNILLSFLLAVAVVAQGFGLACAWQPAQADLFSLVFGLLTLLGLLLLLITWLHVTRRQAPAGAVRTDNARWYWGVFYFAPNDSALFVTKRIGVGLTLNYAHPASWFLLLGVVAVVATIAVLSN